MKRIYVMHGSRITGILTNYSATVISETNNPHRPFIVQPDYQKKTLNPWKKHIIKTWDE